MVTRHTFLYLGSRLAAASANLASVAIFTRLAGTEVYGGSLLVFAWAFLVFGFCGQWLGASFFALHRPADAERQVALMARMSVAALVVSCGAIAIAAMVGAVSWAFGGTVMVTTAGLLCFVTVTELERTRLQAGRVAVMYILRAALILVLGSATLLLGGGSLALALALSIASLTAALPGILRLLPDMMHVPDRKVVVEVASYAWPLIIAFGVMAAGQNVDRLILARFEGTGSLGAYGATFDFLKQGFGVAGEAIALAYMSVAKDARTRGDLTSSRLALEDAFRAVLAIIVFGAVAMTLFSADVVNLVFGPSFRAAAQDVLPWLIFASSMVVLRAFYFGQAIYFGQSSRNEAIASLLMIAVTSVVALLGVPRFGVHGAALAATAGQFAACAVFAVARPRMPIPVGSALSIVSIGLATLTAALLIGQASALGAAAKSALQFALLMGAGAGVVWSYDILGLRSAARLVAAPFGSARR